MQKHVLAYHSLNCQIIFQSTFVSTLISSLTVSIHFLAVRQNDAGNMWRCFQFFQDVTKKSHSVVDSFPPFPCLPSAPEPGFLYLAQAVLRFTM